MKLDIQKFGGRGASSNKINFSQIQVGYTFQWQGKEGVYNVEVTRKNKNDYTVQAKSYTENGKTTPLIGLAWINNLVNKGNKNTPRGYIKFNETKNWKRK